MWGKEKEGEKKVAESLTGDPNCVPPALRRSPHKLEGSLDRTGSSSPLSTKDSFRPTAAPTPKPSGCGKEPEDICRDKVTRAGMMLQGFPASPLPPAGKGEKLETDSREEWGELWWLSA